MNQVIVLVGSACGSLFFVSGFLLGTYLRGRNIQVIEKQKIVEVPKVQLVDRVVADPNRQASPPAPQAPRPAAGQFLMQPSRKTAQEQQEEARIGELLDEPELSTPPASPSGIITPQLTGRGL